MEKLIFEYKNKGVKNPNKYYLLNGDTIKFVVKIKSKRRLSYGL